MSAEVVRISAAAHLIARARSSYQVNESGINVWIACALDEAGMLTIPSQEVRHVDQ